MLSLWLWGESMTFLPRQQDDDIILHSDEFSEDELKRIIRALNLKVTNQRMAILKSLHEGRRHITAQELFEKVIKIHSEIGFATVYRFLKTLTEGHFVTEVRMGGLPARYELTPKGHHDHLTCEMCGKIVEFENRAIEQLQEKVAQQFGFKLTHHVLELYGTCSDCQARLKTRE
jgi:Fur family ferric uptake transcriptional regulator